MTEQIQAWFMQAKLDFEAAKKSYHVEEYAWSSFQCQQAVEKSLKAVFLTQSGKLERIHDLVFLSKKVGMDLIFQEKLERLSKVYIETRYPDFSGKTSKSKFTKSDAQKFISITQEVLLWCEKQL